MNSLNLEILIICILLSAIFQISYCLKNPRITNEKKLIKHIQKTYPIKWGRPVLDHQEKFHVSFSITLNQILELNAYDQSLVTNIWSRYLWNDPFLKWNPKDFNGLSTIRVPASEIYTPDIVLFNNADQRIGEKQNMLVTVNHDGNITFLPPPAILFSTCEIDTRNFPFDIQNCSLVFGSWTYETSKLDMDFIEDVSDMDLSEYVQSPEWNIVKAPGNKNIKLFESNNFTVMTYHLILKRNGGFIAYILIVPCILMAVLTMVVFWVPPENSAKLVLGMNIFGAFFFLLLLLANILPTASNNVPLIGIYYCTNMIMIALSSFINTIVVHMFMRADKFCRVPKILRVIFLNGLAKVFCVIPKPEKKPASSALPAQIEQKNSKFNLIETRFKNFRENMILSSWEKNNTNDVEDDSVYEYNSSLLSKIQSFISLEQSINEIRNNMFDRRKKIEAQEEKAKLAMEWKYIALCLDRTFFFLFLIVGVLSLITFATNLF